MPAISAVDSISPAIQRTRDFLFRPFSWGTYLKLGLVAIVTEGFWNNMSSSRHESHSPAAGSGVPSPFHFTPELAAWIVAGVLIALIFSLLVFYLVTRLRFAFFHCLIHNTKQIRPGWHLYRAQATRFFWMNVGVGFCFLALVALIALAFAPGFWREFQVIQGGGRPDIGLILSLVLPLIPIIVLLALAGILSGVILRDWMLPHYALENATAGEAWDQAWARMKDEKRQFLVYALLRVVMPTIATFGLFIVLILPGLALAGSLAAVEFGLHSLFADATGASWLVGILLQVFFGLLAFCFALLVGICLGGPVSTGVREYALLFYGGRYQALGDILYPPAPLGTGTPQLA